MLGVVRLQVLLELPVRLDAVDQGLVAALHAQQRVHGAAAQLGGDLAARDEAQQLAGALCVQRQRELERMW